jgi:hypothetical protein
MSSIPIEIPPDLKRAGVRFGYMVAVAINLAMLIVVQNILEWGWLPFLTEEFAQVVPWISMSLILSIVANLVYQFDDSRQVKSTGQVLVNLVSVIVTYRIFTVFPFDFSAYEFNWATTVRTVLVLAMIGAGIAMFTEALNLGTTGSTSRRSVDVGSAGNRI